MRADQSLTGPVDVIRPRVAESEGPHDVVEDAAGLPRVMQRQDVRMGETRGGLDLPQEAVGADAFSDFGAEHFDRHRATMLAILGEKYHRHAAPANLAFDRVPVAQRRFHLCEKIHPPKLVDHGKQARDSCRSASRSQVYKRSGGSS